MYYLHQINGLPWIARMTHGPRLSIYRELSEMNRLSGYFCVCVWKFRGKRLSRRTPRCHYNSNFWSSVTKLQSQRRRPIPRKWKCHSQPMSSAELCLFLVPVGLLVWLLRASLRRLINTNGWLDLVVSRQGQCVGFSLLLWSTGSYKITSYNLFGDLQTACVNTVRMEQHVSVCLVWVSAPFYTLTSGKRGRSRSKHNQIKACVALKRIGDSVFTSGMKYSCLCVWRGLISQGCDRAEACLMFLWPGSFLKALEQNGTVRRARTEPRSESIEMERLPWSVWRRSFVTGCLLHCSAFKHYFNLWKLQLFRQDWEWESEQLAEKRKKLQ